MENSTIDRKIQERKGWEMVSGILRSSWIPIFGFLYIVAVLRLNRIEGCSHEFRREKLRKFGSVYRLSMKIDRLGSGSWHCPIRLTIAANGKLQPKKGWHKKTVAPLGDRADGGSDLTSPTESEIRKTTEVFAKI